MIPRPARDNNPGDLDSGANWQGLMLESEMTPEQKAEPRFCIFKTPEFGFRALCLLLRNYHVIYKCDTIEQIVHKFAPPTENDTKAYVTAVAHDCGVSPTVTLPVISRDFMFKLAKAITKHETGSWAPYWTDDQLNHGLGLAGFSALKAAA